ncbi:hypothetical protein AGDE_12614 [Angomonas deanei]|nr:hypothetical protein AGDE_12614 [Angomonas deanei]|eukprot:EPY23948.1 hypothetical protein AGDE_12614 [Angomonas deanei]
MATACFHRLFVGRRNKNGMTPSQQEGLCVFLYLLKALETGGQGTDGVCAVSSVARAVYQHVTPKAQGETVREVKNLEEIGEMLQHHFAQTECYSILGDTENRLGLAFLETLLAKGKTDTDVFLLDEAIKGDMIKLLFVPFIVTMREDARDSLPHHAMELEESGEENSEGLPALNVQFETSLFTLLLNDMVCALSQLRTRQGPDAENESARITSLIQQLLLASRLDGQFLHPSQRARYTSTVLQQNWRLLLDASLRGVFQNRVLKNGTPAWMAELIFPFYKSPALYKRGTVNRFIQLLHDWGQGAEMRKTFQAVQRKESATQDQFSVESKACFEKSDPAEEESEYTVNEGDADVNVEEYYRVLNRYKPILHLETCQLIFESCLANVRREQLRQHRVQLSIAEDVLRYMLLTVRKLKLIDSLLEQEEVLSTPAPSDEGDGVGAPYNTIMSVCAAEKDFLSAGRSTEEWKALLETDLFPRLSQLTPP